MKAQLIIDANRINPAFSPPVRKDFVGPNASEDYADAKAFYKVPRELIVPAGEILTGDWCWVHCFPDESGIAFKYDEYGKVVPYRKAPGIVRAIPIDDGCKAAFDAHAKTMAASRGVTLQSILDEVAAGVARSRAMQAEMDAKSTSRTSTTTAQSGGS